MEHTPNELGARKAEKDLNLPTDERGETSSRPTRSTDAVKGRDKAISEVNDGKVSKASVYSSRDGKSTRYDFNDQGRVVGRMESGGNLKQDEYTGFGKDGKATDRTQIGPGNKRTAVPFDKSERVQTTMGEDGKVSSVQTSTKDASAKVEFDGQGNVVRISSDRPVDPKSPGGESRLPREKRP